MKKLYVIVRDDMKKSCQAFHGGHALAEFLLTQETDWDNGTLIYLIVKNEDEIKKLVDKLEKGGIVYSKFLEPDLNNEITGLASVDGKKYFKHLKLL